MFPTLRHAHLGANGGEWTFASLTSKVRSAAESRRLASKGATASNPCLTVASSALAVLRQPKAIIPTNKAAHHRRLLLLAEWRPLSQF